MKSFTLIFMTVFIVVILTTNSAIGDNGIMMVDGESGSGCCNCPPGEKGMPGEHGEHGAKGNPGKDGSDGDKGNKGKKGDKGKKGKKGDLGEKGSLGPRGIKGQPGPTAEKGMKGTTGPMGPKGMKGCDGDKGDKGSRGKGDPGMDGQPGEPGLGRPGPPGQGLPGPPGHGTGGVVYTYWGRHNCSLGNNSELVYSGWVGAGEDGGGGSNFICTTDKPAYYNYPYWYTYPFLRSWPNPHPYNYGYNFKGANMSGVEYKSCNWLLRQMRNQNVPCAVCYVPVRSVQIMIPGTYKCPSGWTREYYGWLMGPRQNSEYRGTFICVAKNPQGIQGYEDDNNGAPLLPIRANCPTGIKCPPYNDNIEMSCVVCTK